MTLTNENTAIVMDSTADFPSAQERYPNMRVVPLYVNFGAESLRDFVELDPHTFYARLRTEAATPTTSQPTPQDFLTTYEELSAYERVYSLHISSRLSGTHGSATLAAQEAASQGVGGDRIRVIDSESVSVGISMLALGIHRLLEEGTTDAEIEALAGSYAQRSGLLFTVDTLEFLVKGGRIGRAKALAGSLLNVKPILTIANGEVVPLTRVRGRGRQKALQEFRRRFEAATTEEGDLHVGIAHAEADEAIAQLQALVLEARPQAQIELVTSLGAVVGTHAGPGTIGFFWFQD